jgi:hypothetical protein
VADDPAEAILHTAGHLGGPLLIVGAHDRAETDRPALGRVSLDIVRRSPYPVLVVPTGQPGPPVRPGNPVNRGGPGQDAWASTGWASRSTISVVHRFT